MAKRVLFTGAVGVSHGQVYLACDEDLDLDENFAGQINGLCGAAVPASLFLVTGINHGTVEMAVELYSGEPAMSDAWEEIVEVSFANSCPEPALIEWGGGVEGLHIGLAGANDKLALGAAGEGPRVEQVEAELIVRESTFSI